MTRLKEEDIAVLSARLASYDEHLVKRTGKGLLAIACHACRVDEIKVRQKTAELSLHVVPITAGQGIIGGFAPAVRAILQFLGFHAEVATVNDASGVAEAYEKGKNGLFMSDDHRFVGINLDTGTVADNSASTGSGYAAALDLMAGSLKGKDVLVIGCGPVGQHAAVRLVQYGANVFLYDVHIEVARHTKSRLRHGNVEVLLDLPRVPRFANIIEATPCADAIPDSLLCPNTRVAAAGIPLGITSRGCAIIGNTLVHDKLELGVATMAVALLNLSDGKST